MFITKARHNEIVEHLQKQLADMHMRLSRCEHARDAAVQRRNNPDQIEIGDTVNLKSGRLLGDGKGMILRQRNAFSNLVNCLYFDHDGNQHEIDVPFAALKRVRQP